MNHLPYRPGVGCVLFNRHGLVFVARRADSERSASGWQLPQGGIDEGESPRAAVFRELKEEIGTRKVEVIDEHPDWLTYDLPRNLRGIAWGGRYRGQQQRWFAMRFNGEGSDIHLDLSPHPEFNAWCWVKLSELPSLAVPFKRAIYQVLAASFERFASSYDPPSAVDRTVHAGSLRFCL